MEVDEQAYDSAPTVQHTNKTVPLSEKLAIVQAWLKQTFDQEQAPTASLLLQPTYHSNSSDNGDVRFDFEQNERTISVLYELYLFNTKQKRACQLKNKLMNSQIEILKQKSEQMQQVLTKCKLYIVTLSQQQQQQQTNFSSVANRLGTGTAFSAPSTMSPQWSSHGMHSVCATPLSTTTTSMSSLSSSPLGSSTFLSASSVMSSHALDTSSYTSAVRALSELACMLDLKDTKLSSYMMAISELLDNLDAIKQERAEVSQSNVVLQTRILTTIERIQKLKVINDKLEHQVMQHKKQKLIESKQTNIEYLNRKMGEYEGEITRLKQKLEDAFKSNNSVEVPVHHELSRVSQSALIKLAEEIYALKARIGPKFEKLQTYHNLPPDMQAVKLKITEARNEIFKLDSQFQRNAQHMWIE